MNDLVIQSNTRSSILRHILSYDPIRPWDENERDHRNQTIDYISRLPSGCLDRQNTDGHITASAFVLSPDCRRLLLTFHRSLNCWLQLGGHIEDAEEPMQTAQREATEESGIRCIIPHRWHIKHPGPFDVDIHQIPATVKNGSLVSEHLHYDFRYLLCVKGKTTPEISSESIDVKWFSLSEAGQMLSSDPVLSRCISKIMRLLTFGDQVLANGRWI
jgi:8-oxo-dGTP pyrophosphatase MutT (NUDIX family)